METLYCFFSDLFESENISEGKGGREGIRLLFNSYNMKPRLLIAFIAVSEKSYSNYAIKRRGGKGKECVCLLYRILIQANFPVWILKFSFCAPSTRFVMGLWIVTKCFPTFDFFPAHIFFAWHHLVITSVAHVTKLKVAREQFSNCCCLSSSEKWKSFEFKTIKDRL